MTAGGIFVVLLTLTTLGILLVSASHYKTEFFEIHGGLIFRSPGERPRSLPMRCQYRQIDGEN